VTRRDPAMIALLCLWPLLLILAMQPMAWMTGPK
jgi:hypothetical protein